MKKLITTLLLILAQQSIAQNVRTVEVTIKDTAVLNMLSANMFISIYNDYYDDYNYEEEYYESEENYDSYYDDVYSPKTKKELRKIKKEQKKLEKELEKQLKEFENQISYTAPVVYDDSVSATWEYEPVTSSINEKKTQWYSWLTSNNIPFDTAFNIAEEERGYYDPFMIKMTNMTKEQMNIINSYQDSISNSSVSTEKILFESSADKMETIYQNLYKKAQAEATILAKVIGATVVKVVRVYDPHSASVSNENYYYDETGYTDHRIEVFQRTFVFEIK